MQTSSYQLYSPVSGLWLLKADTFVPGVVDDVKRYLSQHHDEVLKQLRIGQRFGVWMNDDVRLYTIVPGVNGILMFRPEPNFNGLKEILSNFVRVSPAVAQAVAQAQATGAKVQEQKGTKAEMAALMTPQERAAKRFSNKLQRVQNQIARHDLQINRLRMHMQRAATMDVTELVHLSETLEHSISILEVCNQTLGELHDAKVEHTGKLSAQTCIAKAAMPMAAIASRQGQAQMRTSVRATAPLYQPAVDEVIWC